ncbi:Gp138 family membrane-puncturing spike protein [Gluconobacter sphaericus]|uniref:Baseplate assembly protein n=1 Tax=Gluconobacter sphaericus NBRC 12467 TaxID=1307951 RepID=A0AA37SKC0_9PROT|nr:Gp138 family membrane-puncturing spike protein [Gluconobacter sphaericus]MBF0885550.1 baseplate assembly protein [Gluconobacter sphaericus]GBR56522.1 phage baseplate assembly protein [Gluconobacter sphaericus NBRC 12467]GEB42788.1 hypothetical protein GSP01_15700 [Gluconobacter sphaericus NBRC 12467]GLQ84764.1 hypothetical protein GCM10007872_16720 [Gluconobacter sphaericus NBRC 12467]GLQ85081.1 hypothetical protein GCM10007872_19890 [Gluconobacter sphaericus NBRC 12467]
MASNYSGSLRPTDASSAFQVQTAMIRRVLSMLGAALPVKVLSVNGVGVNPVGFVDVQPLVHQIDGAGNPTPRGVIHNVPYIRLQGGTRAIICDPAVGDTGFIMIASRDISTVKATRSAAAPGSYRQHDTADAIYIGGLLNEAPTEYIGWVDGDVHVKTAGKFIVDAAEMDINCAVKVAGEIAATGDVKAENISLQSHIHPGVQAGSGETGAPQ